MENTLGLLLICLCIGSLVAFAVGVGIIASRSPKSKIGRVAKSIDRFIDNIPD